MTKKIFKSNLPKEMLGQWTDPEVQKKAKATRAANRKKREEARKLLGEDAVANSKLSDTATQTKIINNLVEIALDPNHQQFKWANDMLQKNKLMDFTPSSSPIENDKEKLDPKAAREKLMKLRVKSKEDK